jgi:hypothetical protein
MDVPTARQHFRDLVAQVAEKAKARLPEAVNGRIAAAARLVVLGDVEVLDDGSINVGSSDPARWYHLTGQTCTCKDFTEGKAPSGWCKHRISAGIHKRVQELLTSETPQAPREGARSPLPEARASLNFKAQIGQFEVQVTLRGDTEAELFERLQAVLKRPDVRPIPKPAPRPQG